MSECQRIQATHSSQSATSICFYRSKPKFVKAELLYVLFFWSVKALCMLGKHSTSEQYPQHMAIGIRSYYLARLTLELTILFSSSQKQFFVLLYHMLLCLQCLNFYPRVSINLFLYFFIHLPLEQKYQGLQYKKVKWVLSTVIWNTFSFYLSPLYFSLLICCFLLCFPVVGPAVGCSLYCLCCEPGHQVFICLTNLLYFIA